MAQASWQHSDTGVVVAGREVVAFVAALVVLAALLAAPAATAQVNGAGSIVYVKDFNVWIMPAADPSAARAVTTDGTSGAAYTLARQDDEGRIMAVFSDDATHDVLVRMDQSGNLLGAPFRPATAYWQINELDVNAAGDLVAYTSEGPCDGGPPRFPFPPTCFGVDFAYADGSDPAAISNFLPMASNPSWFSPTQVLVYQVDGDIEQGLYTYEIGAAATQGWLGTCPGFLDDDDPGSFICEVAEGAETTPAGDRLVYAVASDDFDGVPTRLRVFELAGPPPAEPTSEFTDCYHEGPPPADWLDPTTGEFKSPSWSPDGDGLVWELGVPQGSTDPAPPGAGLYLATGFTAAGCGAFASAQLITANGSSPNWGPAQMGPVQQPSPSPTEPPSPTPSPTVPPPPEPEPVQPEEPSPSPSPTPDPGASPTPDPGASPTANPGCPAGQVPPSGFADTAGNTHASNIDCIVWWEITQGLTATQYGPERDVRRDQMASFLARMIENASGTLAPATPQGFTDIAGNLHADNINRLAAAGVARGTSPTTFSPGASVRRDQMASFLVRAYEHLTGETLTASRDHFADIAGNPHRDNINKAAEAGIAAGTSATTFAPDRAVRRDQMASFIARTLGVAVERGHTTPPS